MLGHLYTEKKKLAEARQVWALICAFAPQDPENIFFKYRMNAVYNIGYSFKEDDQGNIDENRQKAKNIFIELIEQGYSNACIALGDMCEKGMVTGVPHPS